MKYLFRTCHIHLATIVLAWLFLIVDHIHAAGSRVSSLVVTPEKKLHRLLQSKSIQRRIRTVYYRLL